MPPTVEALITVVLAIPIYLNIYLAWPVLSGKAGKSRRQRGRADAAVDPARGPVQARPASRVHHAAG